MTSSTAASTTKTWLVPFGPGRRGGLRLICFPHAGASAPIFRNWSEVLGEAIDLCGVQLPGRGMRLREPPVRSMGELARALATAVSQQGNAPFAFFGHSMGGLLAFEVTRELRRRRAPAPRLLFVSSIPAPQVPTDQPRIHQLPKEDLLKRLSGLDGTPKELIEHPELMDSWLPTFRWRAGGSRPPLDSPCACCREATSSWRPRGYPCCGPWAASSTSCSARAHRPSARRCARNVREMSDLRSETVGPPPRRVESPPPGSLISAASLPRFRVGFA